MPLLLNTYLPNYLSICASIYSSFDLFFLLSALLALFSTQAWRFCLDLAAKALQLGRGGSGGGDIHSTAERQVSSSRAGQACERTAAQLFAHETVCGQLVSQTAVCYNYSTFVQPCTEDWTPWGECSTSCAGGVKLLFGLEF